MAQLKHDLVLIFDFGSQYSQLIVRRVRELGFYAELVRHDLKADRVKERAPNALIFSGGPNSVYEAGAPSVDPDVLQLGIPILGICYGMQLVCHQLGDKVESFPSGEFGRTTLTVDRPGTILQDVPKTSQVWMSHGDQVRAVGGDWKPLAHTGTCPIAVIEHQQKPIVALQFHPEVTHTEAGKKILSNFLLSIARLKPTWRMDSFLNDQIAEIKKRVGTNHVVCGLSGGVDSAVTAALIHRAIGKQLTCIFVDNGLLRANERDAVEQTFRKNSAIDLRVVDASEQFLSALSGVTDPQKKRKIIGHEFIEAFKREAASIADVKFLAQGTLYPDVIESGTSKDGPAATIKTHHNVGGLPDELGFELIEPLRDLFKDETRQLGLELGLPEELVFRHPFPGPGLAVRCLGEITREKLDLLRKADKIFLEVLKERGAYRTVSQAFAVLLPVQSVGVMGDYRTYESCVALRAVTTDDFMTADWARLDTDLLAHVSTRIINEVRGINRVVYDISTKPPATIEWE